MPRTCTACSHPDREAVERDLVRGTPKRRIAEAHGLTESALRRHQVAHIPTLLASAEEAREAAKADRLLAESLALQAKALELVARAEIEGDVRAAVIALREARECVGLRARVAATLPPCEAPRTTFADLARAEVESVDVAEARDLMVHLIERILRFVPEERREEALREVEKLLGAQSERATY